MGRKKAKWGEAAKYLREVVIPYTGSDCLLWPFTTSPQGYGIVRWNNRRSYVSRVVCEHFHGKPPHGALALHSCDNGSLGCVNPAHIRWGTHIENMKEMRERGRSLSGERNSRSKLTADQIIEIRRLSGTATQRVLAARFGVDPSHISCIITGRRWGAFSNEGTV